MTKRKYFYVNQTFLISLKLYIFGALLYQINLTNGLVGGQTDEKQVRTIEIEAVEGRSVSMPCPLAAPSRDKVYMVLWFRDDAGIPLYSFDVRGKPIEQARHWSSPDVFGPRARFLAEMDKAVLEINDIKRHDQGIYRCRVDFRTSQTQSFRYNLSVIIPPEHPIVLNRWGRQLNQSTLGPLEEGDDLMLTCRVIGGRPPPEVRWLINGLLVDNQHEHNSEDLIENRLLWPAVQRTDLNSVFTCQAENTVLMEPKETNLVLDLHLKPLTVKILNAPPSLVADRRYEVTCESAGSRPNAIITWYKGKRQLRRTKDDTFYNTTRSELSFVPSTEDEDKTITCRSENPKVNGLYLETHWKLNIVYPPIVGLRLGSTLSAEEIKEGDDVYFECHVKANPPWRKLNWMHDGNFLNHNASARIIRSNQSLVLQKVTKDSSGNYTCSAINAEGETVSNQLLLSVKYIPFCKIDRIVIVGALNGEQLSIPCEVQSDPPPRSFRWKFDNSGESTEVSKDKFYINGSTSILKFSPTTDEDYGTLSCWAQNSIGTQKYPCLFQVVLAGLPTAVRNCTINNHTQNFLEVQCQPGNDGGLPQIFVINIVTTTGKLRYNLTNMDEPFFTIDSLESLLVRSPIEEDNHLNIIVFPVNQKGRGPVTVLKNISLFNSIRNHAEPSKSSFELSPILSGIIASLSILMCLIVVQIYSAKRSRRNYPPNNLKQTNNLLYDQEIVKNTSPRWQHSEKDTSLKTLRVSQDCLDDECDPDVIPAQFVLNDSGVNFKEKWCDENLHTLNRYTNHENRPKHLLLKSITHHNVPERDHLLLDSYLHSTVDIPTNSRGDIDVHAIKTMLMTTRVPESCV